MRRAILISIAAIAVVAPAGCGSDDSNPDEDQIREVVAKFEDSIEAKDTEAFCDLLAPSETEKLGGRAACLRRYSPDRNVLFMADDTDMSVDEVEIADGGASARALLANMGFVLLAKENDTWYIALVPSD